MSEAGNCCICFVSDTSSDTQNTQESFWTCETCNTKCHLNCITRWAQSNSSHSLSTFSCPVCRHSFDLSLLPGLHTTDRIPSSIYSGSFMIPRPVVVVEGSPFNTLRPTLTSFIDAMLEITRQVAFDQSRTPPSPSFDVNQEPHEPHDQENTQSQHSDNGTPTNPNEEYDEHDEYTTRQNRANHANHTNQSTRANRANPDDDHHGNHRTNHSYRSRFHSFLPHTETHRIPRHSSLINISGTGPIRIDRVTIINRF